VHYKIRREDRPPLPVDLGSASVPVQVFDRRSQVRLTFPVGKDKPAHLGPFPLPEHGSQTFATRQAAESMV